SQRQTELPADALQIAPHVAPLRGIDVEGGVVPSLQPEDRTEQERLPGQRHAGGARRVLDAHRGGRGGAARELRASHRAGPPGPAGRGRPPPTQGGGWTTSRTDSWSWSP